MQWVTVLKQVDALLFFGSGLVNIAKRRKFLLCPGRGALDCENCKNLGCSMNFPPLTKSALACARFVLMVVYSTSAVTQVIVLKALAYGSVL